MQRPGRRARGARPPSPAVRASQLAFRLQRIDPIRVSVRRGGVTKAVHRVHAVAVQDGAVIAAARDAGLVAFMRSSSKPLQAIPVARARVDLHAPDLAVASGSHLADYAQLAAVRARPANARRTLG